MESGSSKAPTVSINNSKPSIMCMPSDMMAPKMDPGSVQQCTASGKENACSKNRKCIEMS
jgi:hypothetical protein